MACAITEQVVFLAIAVLALSAGGAVAQSLKHQIVGTWVVVSATNEVGGKTGDLFGPHPLGYFIYTAGGHFENATLRSDLPKFSANNRIKGSARENQAVVQGSILNFGTYTIDEASHSITAHYIGSSYPNWTDTQQTRLVEISGERMRATNPCYVSIMMRPWTRL